MIRRPHRYAMRVGDDVEEQMQFLRSQYRYKTDTEIICLAIASLYTDNLAARAAAEAAAPHTMSLKGRVPNARERRQTKGGKPCKAK